MKKKLHRPKQQLKPSQRKLTESDYFNCLHNTRLSDGEFMSKQDAEILASELISWKPMLV